MAKKRNKADDGKARLRQRLKDLAYGALGGYHPPDFESEEFVGMVSEMGIDSWGRWVGAIHNALLGDERKMYVEPRYLERYDSLDTATEFLWEIGVRP